MTIYISHSRNFDYHKDWYGLLKNSTLAKEHQFVFPHEKSSEPFNTKELFQKKQCDLVIAEVSYPATGQGVELGWANIYEIPIVCISKEGASISHSLHAVSDTFLIYKNAEEMIEKISGFLKSQKK